MPYIRNVYALNTKQIPFIALKTSKDSHTFLNETIDERCPPIRTSINFIYPQRLA